jgi:diguanylate cyclase (GGDEF)-like protein
VVPILWLAPLDKFEARLAAARAGVDGFLARPFDIDDLKARIETLAQRLDPPPCRVLVVASDAARLDGIEGALAQAGMEALRLHKPLELIATLSRHHPDAIVIDVDTPACNGVDLARMIRQDPAFLDLPVLVLADDRDPAARRRAVAAGVDDFLAPPETRADLALAVMMRVERSRALRSLIMRDGMTGLYNHVSIKEQLLREMARSKREGSPLALAMVDLDFFKKINDTYGHQVGDQVIRAIAHILQQRLRHGDLIGRYGGEEFAVIMPGTSAAAAGRVLDDIRALFATVRHKADETVFHATFSAGVADLDVAGDADPADLFRRADEALYEAKHAGRNRVALARAEAGRA